MNARRFAAFALLLFLAACTGPQGDTFEGDPGDPDARLNLRVDTPLVGGSATQGVSTGDSRESQLVDTTFIDHSQVALFGLTITAICVDGWYSYSKTRAGTCVGHGGVRDWVNVPGR